jgi:hypothetical protein
MIKESFFIVVGRRCLIALLGGAIGLAAFGKANANHIEKPILSTPIKLIMQGASSLKKRGSISYRLNLKRGKYSHLTLIPSVRRHTFFAHVMFSSTIGTPTLDSDKAMVENLIPWSEFANTIQHENILDGLKGATEVVSLDRGNIASLALLLRLIEQYNMIAIYVNPNSVKLDIFSQQNFVTSHNIFVMIQQEDDPSDKRWFTLQSLYNEISHLNDNLGGVIDTEEVNDLLSEMVEDSPFALAHTFEERHVDTIVTFFKERNQSCSTALEENSL